MKFHDHRLITESVIVRKPFQITMRHDLDLWTSKSIGRILDSWWVSVWSFMIIGWLQSQLSSGNHFQKTSVTDRQTECKPIAGVKLSARPLALATISLVWAHEIIKAFAHLATVNLLSCKRFISSFDLNPLTYIVHPFYLGALFRQHWFCTQPGWKLTTWVEKFICLDIELTIY